MSASTTLCGVNAEDLRWVDSPVFLGARIAALYGDPYNGPDAVRMQPAPFPIFAESETRCFLKTAPPGSSVGIDARIEFMKGASGVVTGVSLGNRKASRVSK